MSTVIPYGSGTPEFVVDPGTYQATLTYVVDLGWVPGYKEGTKVEKNVLVFQLNAPYVNKDGATMNKTIHGWYTVTKDERGNLKKVIEGMLGKPLVVGKEGFNITSLIGTQCMLSAAFTKKQDGSLSKFCKISSVMPLMAGLPPMVVLPQPMPAWLVKKTATAEDAVK
jgi:hypothetical protein